MEAVMRVSNSGEPAVRYQLAILAAAAVLSCASAWSEPQPNGAAGSGGESAVWVPKELDFTYTGFTTRYTCDGLKDKMRKVLFKLGASRDLQVRAFGCIQVGGQPATFSGVRIKMNVLQPGGARAGQTVPAQWKLVDMTSPDPVDAAADCDLIEQIKEKVLPLFATRNVDYAARCEKHKLLVGATRLKAEVLVADQSAVDTAAR
jgi:hypothetical protein